jgi:hypothetical protein
MLMPWGKYEGTPVEELPEEYLWWLYRNPLDSDSEEVEELCEAIEDAWHARQVVIRKRYAQLKRQVFRKSKGR